MMNFKDLGISQNMISVLKKSGIVTPTPIQEESIPLIKNNKDVIAEAQTGTGTAPLPLQTPPQDHQGKRRAE